MKPESESAAHGHVSERTRSPGAPDDVTALLKAWGAGERKALDALIPQVYLELRRQATLAMRGERREHTLQATALVHEVYLRLARQRNVRWQSRSQFFRVTSQLMRRILVDHARARLTRKRGAGADVAALTDAGAVLVVASESANAATLDVLALDRALTELAALDPRQARLVELRFFAGLGIEETATTLGVSPATVKREWRVARAWLRRALSDPRSL